MVSQVPAGRVATYGQIARLLNRPHGARQVGYALANLGDKKDVPWHRIINARGEISARAREEGENLQRIYLEDEGISFELDGRVDLKRYLWEA